MWTEHTLIIYDLTHNFLCYNVLKIIGLGIGFAYKTQ